MNNRVRLSENDLVRLVKRILREQDMGVSKKDTIQLQGCRKPSSKEDLRKIITNSGYGDPIYCFQLPKETLNKLAPYKSMLFKYNKQANVLTIFEDDSDNFFVKFFGDWYGDKILAVKMPPAFASAIPSEYSEENFDSYNEVKVEGGKVCLYISGLC